MKSTRSIWRWLALVCVLSFSVLLYMGREIWLSAPPIPDKVVSSDGKVLYTGVQIQHGQQVWLAAGGQQIGTVWGHGSYVAPDWSADWLHREAIAYRDELARNQYHGEFESLTAEEQAVVSSLLVEGMRKNRYDAQTSTLIIPHLRALAIEQTAKHYDALYGDTAKLATLRDQYAMTTNSVPSAADRVDLTAFYFWAAWATATDMPGERLHSYTNNWPHEPLVQNTPTTANGMWSIASVIILLAGIAAMVWVHMARGDHDEEGVAPEKDPLFSLTATPSMKATKKYFYVVIGLLLTQIGMGAITAHFAVEGSAFFGIPLADVLPFSVSRTIHTQFGVLWIATAWLATGLYIAPLLAGFEPKLQKLGVDVLFWALIFIVVGSTACGWLGTLQHRGVDFTFWLGSQGLEFTSMGRIWQYLLFAGLLIWLGLMARALIPAIRQAKQGKGLIAMVFLSASCIGLFYASSLVWGQHTHYSMIEYWRWWLVHLWVEGFFEVFATAVIALIFARLGLVKMESANRAIVLETIVFLFGGILGTLHHLFFVSASTGVIALGAVFSAFEVVPLALVGFEGWQTWKRTRAAPWVATWRWPILFFVAVGVWNSIGAGLLGFSINPPISLYYVQGLNMTPAHGHAALFGVYGMLGIGLMLFCLKGMSNSRSWDDKLLSKAFWCLNIGLAMMVFLSVLPSGIYQAWASVSQGLWYARSPEIVHSAVMHGFVWARVPGDIVFAIGALYLALFAARLLLAPKALKVESRTVNQKA
ncbi:nitric-oxide reductase large subunit [Burkholderiaceae bacterium DAT-1]|nr:nitric-oxide reductase large subunit [Burkholderiaceae bacterium DAT-1]